MMLIIIILAAIGFCIAAYTYFTEKKFQKDPSFKPVCDISDKISCTKPMASPYANILFVSNAIIAMLFYVVIAIFALLHIKVAVLVTATAGVIGSLFLAYLLFFKIKTLCLLCTSMYLINILILIFAIRQLF